MDTSKADREAFERLTNKVEAHSIGREEFAEHVKSDERQLSLINNELGIQRGHITKIFDKLEAVREDMHAQHSETREIVLSAISRNRRKR